MKVLLKIIPMKRNPQKTNKKHNSRYITSFNKKTEFIIHNSYENKPARSIVYDS